MKKALLSLLTVSLLFISCEKQVAETDTNLLIGRWLWQKSVGGIAGQVISPQPGSIKILHFITDSTYNIDYATNNLTFNKYSLTEVVDLETNTTVTAVIFYDETMRPSIPQIISFKQDADGKKLLFFKENIIDGYTHHYKETD